MGRVPVAKNDKIIEARNFQCWGKEAGLKFGEKFHKLLAP